MALVNLHEIYKQYEAQKVLCGVNFHLEEGERVCIVGKNGSGKSTLLKLIDQSIEYDEGEIILQNNISIKRLHQKPQFEEAMTVREAIEAQLVEYKEAYANYNRLIAEFENDYDNTTLQEEINRLSTFLDMYNAWNIDDRIERILGEFDLKRYEQKEISLLSGGEQRRVALAGLLLQKPDVLLLDEPTNHLDVYMVEFLEEILLKENYTFVVISHDRYFIDRLSTRVVEIEECKLKSFQGGYRDYLHAKEEMLRSMQKSHQTLVKQLKREEEWLSRGVKARLKRNEGRKQRVFEMREQAKKNPSMIRKMTMALEREKLSVHDQKMNKQKMLFELEHIDKHLGDKLLIKNFTTRILQKDKIGIVGKNGSGKSTLLKILLKRLPIDAGKIKHGDISIGYFDQHREMIKDNKTLIETFCPDGGDRVDVRGRNMHVYGYLKQFLFPKEFLDKKIGILSGGEKNRVALALLFTKHYDLLILDEPTNDLDIPTINILEEYLIDFAGAIIFVSHDRYFVDKLSKKLFVFRGEGVIEESYIPYSEYLDIEKEINEMNAIEIPKEKIEEKKEKKQTKLSYKENYALENLPSEIEALEEKVEKLNRCLSAPSCYEERGIQALSKELEEIQTLLDEKVEQFLKLEEKRESLEG